MRNINNRRYVAQEVIGSGAMGVIYRAYDRLEGGFVAIKQVKLSAKPKVVSSTDRIQERDFLATITHEFKLLAGLRHPNIISVKDYGFNEEKMPYYVMEFLEEAEEFVSYGRTLDTKGRTILLVELLQALEYHHRRGVIHRDIKPSNVLITVAGEVKVLDFGLATLRESFPKVAEERNLVGTLYYMAPETFKHSLMSEQSDLYAVDVMAYELFAGVHPFYADNIAEIINRTLTNSPDLSPILALDKSLAIIIGRLLEKDPQDRYNSAYQVMQELVRLYDGTLQAESIAIRESFLQSARMVGRDEEMAQLTQAHRAARGGQGSLWFIAGESGIGKTRLLEETRIQALIEQSYVLWGRANAADTHPLQMWGQPIRHLVIDETFWQPEELPLLRLIIPDLETLLNRPIEAQNAEDDDGRDSHHRLVALIVRMLTQQAQAQPTLLILEDLHWAEDGLAPLQELANTLSNQSLLIVASYRSDEFPHLTDSFTSAQTLKLKRLTEAQIITLTNAMIGATKTRPEVIDLLKQETEGNTYFLIETIRALAREAGALQQIGLTTLPQSVFAGGIQQIVLNRINRVPQEAQALLGLAALAGRVINLDLLRVLSGGNIEAWLRTCEDAAILNVENEEWQFSHDKLRQMIVSRLDEAQKQAYHRHIAQALEALHSPSTPLLANITHHYAEAGDEERVQHYAPQAAAHASRVCAYRDVLRFVGMMAQQSIKSLQLVANAYEGLGDYDNAMRAYQDIFHNPQARDEERIIALNGLSMLSWRRNRYDSASDYAHQALVLAAQLGDAHGEATALNNLGIVASDTGDFAQAQTYYERGLALRRAIGDRQGEGYILSSLGIATLDQSKYVQACNYFQEALGVAEEIGDRHEAVFALHGLSMALCNLGAHEEAARTAESGLAIAQDLNNVRDVALCQWRLAATLGFRHPTPDTTRFDEALTLAEKIGDQRLAANILADKSAVLFLAGAYAQSTEALSTCYALRQAINDRGGIINTLLQMGKIAREQGDFISAEGYFTQALQQATAIDSSVHITDSWLQLAILALATGDLAQAEQTLKFAESTRLMSEAVAVRGLLDVIWGHYWLEVGNLEQARACYERTTQSPARHRTEIAIPLATLAQKLAQ